MNTGKKEKKVLGRGLSALISTPLRESNTAMNLSDTFSKNFEKEKNNIVNINNAERVSPQKINLSNEKKINISDILVNESQPREDFEEKNLEELSVSIKKHGVLQPILVREKGDKYEIIAGERRFRAAKKAGLKEVPVILKELNDTDAYEIAVIENIQRENLNPIEQAKAYQKIILEQKISQAELAEKLGKERSTITNFLRVLELSQEIQEMIKDKILTLGHAKVLLSLKEKSAQKSFAKKVQTEGLSVRELEKLVSDAWVLDAGRVHKSSQNSEKQKRLEITSKFPEIVDVLRQKLGTRINIKHQKSGKGKIEIEYYSEDELDRVVQLITKE